MKAASGVTSISHDHRARIHRLPAPRVPGRRRGPNGAHRHACDHGRRARRANGRRQRLDGRRHRAHGSRRPRTIAIVSPNPAAGKSFTAVHLAESAVGVDARVVVIDADLRRPVRGSAAEVRRMTTAR